MGGRAQREGGCVRCCCLLGRAQSFFFFFLWKRDKTVRGRLPCGWCTFIFWLCRLSLLSALSIPVLAPPVHPLKSRRSLFFVRLFAWTWALPRTPMRRRAVLHCCIDEPREVLSASGREVAAPFQEKGVSFVCHDDILFRVHSWQLRFVLIFFFSQQSFCLHVRYNTLPPLLPRVAFASRRPPFPSREHGTTSTSTSIGFTVDQLLRWCGGKDFDGCILLDECHRAKNLYAAGGGAATKAGQAVVELQAKLPNARCVRACFCCCCRCYRKHMLLALEDGLAVVSRGGVYTVSLWSLACACLFLCAECGIVMPRVAAKQPDAFSLSRVRIQTRLGRLHIASSRTTARKNGPAKIHTVPCAYMHAFGTVVHSVFADDRKKAVPSQFPVV